MCQIAARTKGSSGQNEEEPQGSTGQADFLLTLGYGKKIDALRPEIPGVYLGRGIPGYSGSACYANGVSKYCRDGQREERQENNRQGGAANP